MVDSESVVIHGEVTSGRAFTPVVPAPSREREQALEEAGDEAVDGAGAMVLERELVLAGVDDRLDPLPHAGERAEARLLVAAVGTDEGRPVVADDLLELLAREALVADDHLPWLERPLDSSAATSRSGAFAGASSNAIGIPSGAQSKYRRKPQKKRECEAQ
jgi:hypothetical protein